jgi:hypothetical protein
MKKRNGLVSNSSSSSFCGVGIFIDKHKVTFNPDNILHHYEISTGEEIELRVVWVEDDSAIIARPISTMKDEETFKQFKDQSRQNIVKVFGEEILKNNEPGLIEEGWYDG